MAIKQSEIKDRLAELKSRAQKRNSFRDIPTEKQLKNYEQNAKDLIGEQYKTIK